MKQFSRNGTPEQKFWARVQKCEGDGCWTWTGRQQKRKGKPSYGLMPLGKRGQYVLAHVFAYEMVNGKVPEGMVVRHRCDNPPCVRPDHLLSGTQADNLQDMRDRGRAFFNKFKVGTSHPNAKVDADKVRLIRQLRKQGKSCQAIAKEIGIHASSVHDIATGKTWSHVPDEPTPTCVSH